MHAGDEEYDSPYMQLARQQGLDLPWWQKVRSSSFSDGKFSLGGLKVGAHAWLPQHTCGRFCVCCAVKGCTHGRVPNLHPS